MAKKQFKAESKRLLDLMINSIYTNREIFLRELISNASDATDKRYYNAISGSEAGLIRDELAIEIALDKSARTLTISDSGCGMSEEDLNSNLGVIAKSGSLAFKKENENLDDVDIIGQFGVGFYAAFMVAKKVSVLSRAVGSDKAYLWESDGADGYTITEAERDEVGTTIVLQIKDNTEEENYDEFLEQYRISALVKKYSDYIRYPIKMDITTQKPKEGVEGEFETEVKNEVLNSQVPLWKKEKSEITDDELNNFYQSKFHDYEAPARTIYSKTEGMVSYTAMMFVPSNAPFDFYSKDYVKGLSLYTNGVMIMEKCSDLLPDYFSFVRGIVDSQDLSLNISREMLQHDRQLKVIATSIEKKIRGELLSWLKADREGYEKFFEKFGPQLKYGVYAGFGMNKDKLSDLLLFYSSSEEKQVTLDEYVTRMKEDQKFIYFVAGESNAKLDTLPQVEYLKSRGIEVLYLTGEVDEFAVRMMNSYKDKTFRSITEGDLELMDEGEKKELEEKASENADLLAKIKEILGEKVSDVKLSGSLMNSPVAFSTEGGMSSSMEKFLNSMPSGEKVKATRILEINANHEILNSLKAADEDKLKTYAEILYTQAQLIDGIAPEDPVEFARVICSLM